VEAHDGVQGFTLTCLGNTSSLVSCGFRKDRTRQARIWDMRNLSAPLHTHDMDQATGQLIPMFDEDTNTLFLAGKGDTTVRVFEITKEAPYIVSHSLVAFLSCCRVGAMYNNVPPRVAGQALVVFY
jgi:hypothetical protein